MSNISKEIEGLVGGDVVSAVNDIKDMYGTISGAYGYYKAGKSVLTALGILEKEANPFDGINEKLDQLNKKLDNILGALEKDRLEQAEGISLITRTMVLQALSVTNTAAYNAYWYLKNPDSDDLKRDFKESRKTAQDSVNFFKDIEEYWLRPYLVERDYADEWSETLSPPTERGGFLVWDFIMTMPAYLAALANWCIVVLASDDGFIEAHLTDGSEIVEHIEKLHDSLVKVSASFEPIPCPDYNCMRYIVPTANDENFFCYKLDGTSQEFYSDNGPITISNFPTNRIPCSQKLMNDQLNYIPYKWRKAGYPVGVVEKYSAWISIAAYPGKELIDAAAWLTLLGHPLIWSANIKFNLAPTIGVTNPDKFHEFYDRFLLRHTIRTWEQGRKLSAKLGLPAVRKCITDLCAMRKEPLSKHPVPPEWNRYVLMSMRELWSVVPDSLRNSAGSAGIGSMRKLAEFARVQKPITLRRIFSLDAEN